MPHSISGSRTLPAGGAVNFEVRRVRERTWRIAKQPDSAVDALVKALRVPGFVARVLINRGLDDPAEARAFLQADERCLFDPFLMRDMEKAVERICRAVRAGEKIVVYGDYDADGVTAACSLILYLRAAGANVELYIPDRTAEGYGVHLDALKSIRDSGASLVVTVDTGITAAKELLIAAEAGLDAVVTDHHECKDTLPDCCAVVNPRRPDCSYPFKSLAGVGVAYKLIKALDTALGVPYPENSIRCLTAIGTVADLMPLVSENRVLVRLGLDDMNLRISNIGIRALMLASGVDTGRPVTASTVGYILAPRVNAAGRMGCAVTAAELFLAEDPRDAARLAAALCDENRRRQKVENEIFEQALSDLETQFNPQADNCAVLCRKGWHHGVIGIVASRVAERLGVPCILLSEEDGEAKGSGRSVPGVNLFGALCKCAPLLTCFGGHELAAGLTLPADRLDQFKALFSHAVAEYGPPKPPSITIDCVLSPEELTLNTARAVAALEPFGAGNPPPCFALRDASVVSVTPLSGDKHSKLVVRAGSGCFTGLFFGVPTKSLDCAAGDRIDAAFSAEVNSFRGQENLSLILRDIKVQTADAAKTAEAELEEIYIRVRGGDLTGALAHAPDRDDLAAVYRYFTGRQNEGVTSHNRPSLPRSVESRTGRSMDICRLLLCLDILAELGIFSVSDEGGAINVTRRGESGKVALTSSPLWRAIERARADAARIGNVG